MEKRVIWIAIVLIILSGAYYWVVVDNERLTEMESLEKSDSSLKGDVNEWSEYYDRIEKKWIGTSKHVKTLQEETESHYENYEAKVDSINNSFEKMDFKVDQLNEVLSSRIDLLKDELESLTEEFSTYKRTSQREVMKLKKTLDVYQEDITKLKAQWNEEFGED